MKIVIVDYHMGNIHSIQNALDAINDTNNFHVIFSHEQKIINSADALILPGVGAFSEAMAQLSKLQLLDTLHNKVITEKTPMLGICLGMQLLCSHSSEFTPTKGLNFIDGRVEKITTTLALPHVGWNNIAIKKPSELFENIPHNTHFYFDHSYHVLCDESYISATSDYATTHTVAIKKEHIFGVQFHPEKSQQLGLELLRNFITYVKVSQPC